MGIVVFAQRPAGEPLDWVAELFPGSTRVEVCEGPWSLPPDFAMIGTHEGRALVVLQDLPWDIVSNVLMPGVFPETPMEAWAAEGSRMGDVLVASMHSTTEDCGHAVFRAGRLVLKVCRCGQDAGALLRTSEIPAWYPRDPVVALQPWRTFMPAEEQEPIPEVLETTDLAESAFRYRDDYLPALAEALLGAPLAAVIEGVTDWVCVRL